MQKITAIGIFFKLIILYSFKTNAAEYTELPVAPQTYSQENTIIYFLTLVVNGQEDQQVSRVKQENGHYFISANDLNRNHIKSNISNNMINVSKLDQVKIYYNAQQQKLELTVPDDWLPHQDIYIQKLIEYQKAMPSSSGFLFNYDVYYINSDDTQTQNVNTWLEQRFFHRLGILSNSGVYRQGIRQQQEGYENGYIRYDTYWRNNDPKRILTYQIGDLLSNALTWTTPIRLAGFQISRNFTIRPDIITYPLLQYSGVTSTPSSIDLFVNDNKVISQNISSGPYTLNNTPYINGAGEATIVTTDALGRQVSTSIPFYVANNLLKEGLDDFDFSVGWRRLNYGIVSNKYDTSPSVSAIYRYGWNNFLTVSGHTESTSGLNIFGVGSDIKLGYWGVLSNSLSQSKTSISALQWTLGYQYQGQIFSLNTYYSKRENAFEDLSTYNTQANLSRSTFQTTMSIYPFNKTNGSLGVGYFDIQAFDGDRTQLVNFSFNRTLGRTINLVLSVNKTINKPDFNTQVQLMIPWTNRSYINTNFQRDESNNYRSQVSASKSTPTDQGIGWTVSYLEAQQRQQQASLTWKTPQVTLQTGLYGQNQFSYWANLSGSVVFMDQSFFFTNKVYDAFLLVDSDGYADIPVFYDNQLIGRTNRNGHILIPSIAAYYNGRVRIDTLDLPVNVESLINEKQVVLPKDKGAIISFPIKKMRLANIKLVDQANHALPVGTSVQIIDLNQQTVVGYDGRVYLTNLDKHNRILIQLKNGQTCIQQLNMVDDQINQDTFICPFIVTQMEESIR